MQGHQTAHTASAPRRHPLRAAIAAALLTAAALMGCSVSGRSGPGSPAAPGIPLPAYLAGTTYVYSNGSWETVQAATPQTVTWVDHRGHRSTGSPDFTYRRSAWETRTRSGERIFRPRKGWSGDALLATVWPLAPGKTARYIESGIWRDEAGREHRYETYWRVEVAGREKIGVKAGRFDAWKIVGRRFSTGGAFRSSRLREIRTWYYAPAAGHYVKLERHYLGRRPDRTTELLAVIPPVDHLDPAARKSVHTSFQQALEEKQSGAALRWRHEELGLAGATTPTATFKLASGDFCRQYVQELNRPDSEQVFYGLACRTEAGRWEVPRR